MTRIRSTALLFVAAFSLSACLSEGSMDADSSDGVFMITHTTKGTLYWEE